MSMTKEACMWAYMMTVDPSHCLMITFTVHKEYETTNSQVDTNCNVKWSSHCKLNPLQWSYIGHSLPCISQCSPQQVNCLLHKMSIQQLYREKYKWKTKCVGYEVGTCILLHTYFYFPHFARILFHCSKESKWGKGSLSDCLCSSTQIAF